MTTRREILAATALLGPLSLAIKTTQASEDQESRDIADFLFVQNAQGITYSDGQLTLKEVNPATIMFSDRPDRIAGHMTSSSYSHAEHAILPSVRPESHTSDRDIVMRMQQE